MNNPDREDALTLEILEAIDERSDLTQRGLAQRTGVALGLANSYLRRCVRKGLVKIKTAPANRYLYYLTPKGFSEKSRLTAEYLRYSLGFYRMASNSCSDALAQCAEAGMRCVAVYGVSELAEIAALRAQQHDLRVVGVVDPAHAGERFLGIQVEATCDAVGAVDAWVLTGLQSPQGSLAELREQVPADRIICPSVLGLKASA